MYICIKQLKTCRNETKQTNWNRLADCGIFLSTNFNIDSVMENHTIIYEGLEMTVFGNWEAPDNTTGYKGGWLTVLIEVNEVDIIWMLKPNIIERISEIVTEIR